MCELISRVSCTITRLVTTTASVSWRISPALQFGHQHAPAHCHTSGPPCVALDHFWDPRYPRFSSFRVSSFPRCLLLFSAYLLTIRRIHALTPFNSIASFCIFVTLYRSSMILFLHPTDAYSPGDILSFKCELRNDLSPLITSTRFTLLFSASCPITESLESYYTQTTSVVTKTDAGRFRIGVHI